MLAPKTRSATGPIPKLLPSDFRNCLHKFGPSKALGAWETQVGNTHEMSWIVGALKLNVTAAMRSPKGQPIAFRTGLTVHLLKPCWSDADTGGVCFETYLFQMPDRLEVVIWLEIDGALAMLSYRGDEALFKVIGFELQVNGDAPPPDHTSAP